MTYRINETGIVNANSLVNANESTTINTASFENTKSVSKGITLDISSFVTDNKAYQGHGKTIEDVVMSQGATDVTARRNYMAVMSNCLSDEDFAKLQANGINPGEADFDEVVTIVDHIKAALIKGGTQVSGYTDTISKEALIGITGSEAYANQLVASFAAQDVPVTYENAKTVEDAYNKLSEVGTVSEGSKKYLVENNLKPSVDNLYTASHVGAADPDKQSRGYYNAGDVSGYYAKKPESVDIEAILPQIKDIVKESNLELNDENIKRATYLVEKGVPLTPENLVNYTNIDTLCMPMTHEEFVKKAANAISDGIKVSRADLSSDVSLRKLAFDYNEEVQTRGTLKGRRVLEEVRLSMSVEANLKLLRRGYRIDTAPMEELVDNLKKAEEDIAKTLTGESDSSAAVAKKDIFVNTIDLLSGLKTSPISIVNVYEKEDTLTVVSDKAASLTATYAKANESYEALMTAPRADLGDSIRKAFGNVDEILESLEMALTDENRRAVRILGYNSIEITSANLVEIKDKDRLLTRTIENLTPGRVLGMIRDGINPVVMSIEELDKYLRNQDTTKEDMMSYSKFLYKLEQDKDITDNEKEAYIGIYRLINQIEKTDYSAIGAVNELGTEFTFENLLSAIRSTKKGSMDYKVDDAFGGLSVRESAIKSITSQIARGFMGDTADLKNFLNEAFNQNSSEEFDNELAEEIRKTYRSEEMILQELASYSDAVSADNIADISLLLGKENTVFNRLKDLGYKKPYTVDLSNKKKAKESFKSMTGSIKEFLSNEVFGTTDGRIHMSSKGVRQIASVYSHLDFLERRAEEENYAVPTEINGETTAINLKVIHSSGEESKVAITFENSFFGRVAAELKVTDNILTGFTSLTNDEMAKSLNENKSKFAASLKELGIEFKDMYFAKSDSVDIPEFMVKESKDRTSDTDVISTDNLYLAAKAFIGFIQESA